MTLPSMVEGYDRSTTLRWCRRIDDGPYSTVAVGERVTFGNQEQLVLLSAAAALTERVRVASTVVILAMHPVALAAKRLATLDVLSGGRLVVGLGVGSRPHDFRAAERPDDRRVATLEARAAELRRLWAGEAPFDGADPVGPPPVQPSGPPLYSSSMGPRSLASSAGWADGLYGFTLGADPAELARGAERVRAAWAAAGRTEPPFVTTSAFCSVGPDLATAEARQRAYAERYLSFGRGTASLAELCTVVGPDGFRRALDAAEAAGLDEFVVVPTTTDEAELDAIEAVLQTR